MNNWRQIFLDGLRRHPVASVISRQSKENGTVHIILTKECPDFAFGAGRRICLGRHLAAMEGAIVLEKFFGKFLIEDLQMPKGPPKRNIMGIDQPGPVIATVKVLE